MRISDWSSDVCSSDLTQAETCAHGQLPVKIGGMEYPGGIIVFKIPDVSHIHESSSVQFGKEKIIQNPEPVLDIPFQFDVSHPVKILQIPISIWLTGIVITSAWTDGSDTPGTDAVGATDKEFQLKGQFGIVNRTR